MAGILEGWTLRSVLGLSDFTVLDGTVNSRFYVKKSTNSWSSMPLESSSCVRINLFYSRDNTQRGKNYETPLIFRKKQDTLDL